MPELSIIIPSYNTKDLLLKCVESVIQSSPKITFEFIVVDNASTDGSVEGLSKLKSGKPGLIRVIENKENLGFSKAVNQGIEEAKGKYFLLLNTDTVVGRSSLDKMMEFAKDTPDAGVVGARLIGGDGVVQKSVYYPMTFFGAVKRYWLNKKDAFGQYAPVSKKPVQVYAVVGAFFLITPQARKEVGLMDEKYFMYYEDLDYCERARKKGLKVYYLPSVEVIHYYGEMEESPEQDRRLIASSKIYHGLIKHNLINFVLWSGQKWLKLLKLIF